MTVVELENKLLELRNLRENKIKSKKSKRQLSKENKNLSVFGHKNISCFDVFLFRISKLYNGMCEKIYVGDIQKHLDISEFVDCRFYHVKAGYIEKL